MHNTHNFLIELYTIRYITYTTVTEPYIERSTTDTILLLNFILYDIQHIKYRSIIDLFIDD